MAEEIKPKDDAQPDPTLKEMTHKDRQISIRETADKFEMKINGVPMKVSRHADGTYHSAILTHRAYKSAEELAKSLAEIEGKLWVAGPGRISGHKPHKPQTPHDPQDHDH